MRKYCRNILILCSVILLLSSILAEAVIPMGKVDALKTLGMIKGTDKGLELDKVFTRAQGTVIVLRILGKETEAVNSGAKSPFTDAQDHWAAKQIAYAYENGIVYGTGTTTFTPERPVTARECIALTLRGLGFKEASPDTAYTMALNTGLLDQRLVDFMSNQKNFLRIHMIDVVYGSLTTKLKDENKNLLQKLVQENAITKEAAISTGLWEEPVHESKPPVQPNTGDGMDMIEKALEDAIKG